MTLSARFGLRRPAFWLTSLVAAGLLVSSSALAFDSDLDAVEDAADAFPCDPSMSSVVFAPAQGQHGMVLFEDQWPGDSDLDFNDAAIGYNYIFSRNSAGQVLSIRATFNVLALGGAFNNGLGLSLPVSTQAASSIRMTVKGQAAVALNPVPGDSQLTLRVLPNMRQLFNNEAGPINSDPNLPSRSAAPVEVEIRFSTPVTLDTGLAPFDLFIFRTADVGHEIHLPQFAGTVAMDRSLFGTEHDGSTTSRHFVDQSGLPYALSFPTLAPWAREGEAVHHLYPRIVSFAASAGTQDQDFYAAGVDLDFAYGWQPPVPNASEPPTYTIANWTPPSAPSFVGADTIPAATGCVNSWGLAVQFGTGRDTFAYDSVQAPDGNLLVTGYTRRSFPNAYNQGAEDAFVAKYNPADGTLLWSVQNGGTASDVARSIAVDSSGNIYIAGDTRSSFGGQSSAGQADAFLMKLNSSGTVLWTRLLGGTGYDYATGVAVDSAGNIFIGGGSNSPTIGGTASPGQGPASFLAKYDTTGNRLWVAPFRSDPTAPTNYNFTSAIALDASGNVLAVGSERRYSQSQNAVDNPFIAKLSGTNGAVQWTQHLGTFGYSQSSGDYRVGYATGVVADSTGAAYIVGSWQAGSQVSSWDGLNRTAGDTSADGMLIKVDASGAVQWQRSIAAPVAANDFLQDVTLDSAGQVYLTGYTAGVLPSQTSRGANDYFAARFAPDGTQQWLTQAGSNTDDGAFSAVVAANQSALFVVGNTGNVQGIPSAFQNYYYGFIARHNLTSGASLSNSPTVDTSTITRDCRGLAGNGSGVYTIDPDNSGPIAPMDVWCDMDIDGGGWIVIANVVTGGYDYRMSANLSTSFVAPSDVAQAFAASSTEIRYACSTGNTIIDFASTDPRFTRRGYAYGDGCGDCYNWVPGTSPLRKLQDNNYNFPSSYSVSCCCRPNHRLISYAPGTYAWFLDDLYYGGVERTCAGSVGTYHRVYYR